MKYVIAWPVGMLAGFFLGSWITGETFALSARPNAGLHKLVLLAFVVAGGIASAALVSSRWWDGRKK